MSKNTLASRLFPETAGTTTNEDGIGIYRSPKAQEQYEARKAAQSRKKKKAKKKSKARRTRVTINVRQVIVVQPTVVIVHPQQQCQCEFKYDAKADVENFENNPYWMHYRRPTLPIGRNPA